MHPILKSKRFYIYSAALVAFLTIDFFIFTSLKPETNDASVVNSHIEQYTPIYVTKSSRSFASLRSGYYFELQIAQPAEVTPTPRDISDKHFLGYAKPNSLFRVVLMRQDQTHEGQKNHSKTVASWPLTRGKKEVTIPGEGDFSKHQFRINLFVKEQELDIKIDHPGLLWNTYSPAKVLYVNLDVTRLRIIHVTPHGIAS